MQFPEIKDMIGFVFKVGSAMNILPWNQAYLVSLLPGEYEKVSPSPACPYTQRRISLRSGWISGLQEHL